MVLKMCCRTRAFCNQLVLGIITVLQTVSAAMCATGGRTISLKVATRSFNQTLYCILFLSFFNVSSRVWLVCLCLGHSSSQDVKDVRNMSLWAARDHRSILHIYLSNPKKLIANHKGLSSHSVRCLELCMLLFLWNYFLSWFIFLMIGLYANIKAIFVITALIYSSNSWPNGSRECTVINMFLLLFCYYFFNSLCMIFVTSMQSSLYIFYILYLLLPRSQSLF